VGQRGQLIANGRATTILVNVFIDDWRLFESAFDAALRRHALSLRIEDIVRGLLVQIRVRVFIVELRTVVSWQ